MRNIAAAGLILVSAVWAQSGLKPPPSASDYRANAAAGQFEIGARLLTIEQVRSTFATPIDRDYLVVEVALYPTREIDVRLPDFALRVGGSGDLLRPIAPRIIAGRVARPARRGRDVELYPAVGVGYGRYGGGGVWTTGAGVGVGIGTSHPPQASDRDLRTMEAELAEQGIGAGSHIQPVAGYLYFAAPKKRTVTFDLEYHQQADRVTLPLVTR
jgi:hypothetical protein